MKLTEQPCSTRDLLPPSLTDHGRNPTIDIEEVLGKPAPPTPTAKQRKPNGEAKGGILPAVRIIPGNLPATVAQANGHLAAGSCG